MGKRIAVVQYNAGNVRSVFCALRRLGIDPVITDSKNELSQADKVIFPGVGEARTAMNYLHSRGLDTVLKSLTQPFLGICLGLQLMCSHSEEHDTDTFGIFTEPVKRFPPRGKVPHMGWNTISRLESPLFQGIDEDSYVYFVHSYYVAPGPDTIAASNYMIPFSAAVHRNNFFGTQFHPEKSGEIGSQILKNFLNL